MRHLTSNLEIECQPGYVKWIYELLNTCISTPKEKWSFFFGICTSVFSNIAAIPQMFTSYRTKRVEGISPFLFSLTLLADIFGLIGNLNSHILINQLLCSAFAVITDGCLWIQFMYYRYFFRHKEKQEQVEYTGFSATDDSLRVGTFLLAGTATAINYWFPYQGELLIGSIFGWLSAICYTYSRIPQVILNYNNKFVRDISPLFLSCAIAGNSTYAISVFLWSIDLQYLWNQLPWLVGVIGPLLFDLIAVFQMLYFGFSVESSQEILLPKHEKLVLYTDQINSPLHDKNM